MAKSAQEFTELYQAKYQTPPDAYATIAYVAYTEMFRGFEAAKTFDPLKVAAALMANNGEFDTVKGPANWREDHSAVYKYARLPGQGEGSRRAEACLGSVQRRWVPRAAIRSCRPEVSRVLNPSNRATLPRAMPPSLSVPAQASRHSPGQGCKGIAVSTTRAPKSSGPRGLRSDSASWSPWTRWIICSMKTRWPASSAPTGPARPRSSIS